MCPVLGSCCSSGQGRHRGDWYFPNGTRLPFSGSIQEARVAQRVDLRRNIANSPSGIYRCHIPTDAVHNEDYYNSLRDPVYSYVGLYAPGGKTDFALSLFVVYCTAC